MQYVPLSLGSEGEVMCYYWTVNVVLCSHQQPPPVLKVVQEGGQGALGRGRWLLCGFRVFLLFWVLCRLPYNFPLLLFPGFLSSPVRFLDVFDAVLSLLLIVLTFDFLGRTGIRDRFRLLWVARIRLAGFIVVLVVFRWYL